MRRAAPGPAQGEGDRYGNHDVAAGLATAFRILAASARHPENIGQAVEERILSRLPKQPALLDVGAGSGKVAERLAPHFGSLTLLEPNQNQIAGFKHEKARIFLEPLERYQSPEQ